MINKKLCVCFLIYTKTKPKLKIKMVSLFEAQTEIDVIKALERGADINETRDRNNITPLFLACESGNLEVVDALLNNGADPLIHTQFDGGPIQIASKNGYLYIVQRLIQAGVDINNDTFGTPLLYASQKGNIDILDFLLAEGADINHMSDGQLTALMMACVNGKTDAVDILLQAGADVNIIDEEGYSALGVVCSTGKIEIVDKLLVYGAIIDIYDSDFPPLISAVYHENINIVDRLIQMGADINIESSQGDTPLHLAVNEMYLEIIMLLLENGANTQGLSDIAHIAEEFSHELIFEMLQFYDDRIFEYLNDIMLKLTDLGVNIDYANRGGQTPLMIAVIQSNLKKVKNLVKLGANVNLLDNDNHSALWYAINVGNREIINLLEEYHAI